MRRKRLNDSFSSSEDPFEYTKREKKKKNKMIPSQINKKTNTLKDMFKLLEKRAESGVNSSLTNCPVCHIPEKLLLSDGESVKEHLEYCKDVQSFYKSLPECPQGKACIASFSNHFKTYGHWRDFQFLNPDLRHESPDKRKESKNLTPPAYSPEKTTLCSHPSSSSTVPSDQDVFSIDKTSKEIPRSSLVTLKSKSSVKTYGEKQTSSEYDLGPPLIISPNFIIPDKSFSENVKVRTKNLDDDGLNVSVILDPNIKIKSLQLNLKQTSIGSFFTSTKINDESPPHSKVSPIKKVIPEVSAPIVKGTKKQCPFYKKIRDGPFAVDAFNYGDIPGISLYLLSHFHYDHFIGLTKKWNKPILCSTLTAKLVSLKIKVNEEYLRPIEIGNSVIASDTEITLLDANHCPGSVMFLFKFKNGRSVLHTGDFRASRSMEELPALWNTSLALLHLDTTYCSPEYDFPDQDEVISKSVERTTHHLRNHPRTLIAVGSYTIGKERIFQAIADTIDSKIYAPNSEKVRVLKCMELPNLSSFPKECSVHVLNMKNVSTHQFLSDYLKKYKNDFDCILGIKPTGWNHSKGSGSTSSLQSICIKESKSFPRIYYMNVPYSEHSSYSELKRFVQFLNLKDASQVIPTVNVSNYASRYKMKKVFQGWVEVER